MIELSPTGRAMYLTTSGKVIQKLNIFFTATEYQILQDMASDSNLPIGKFLAKLAAAEADRRTGATNAN